MFEIEDLGVAEDAAQKIVHGVAVGDYSLLLGAGFSVGAKAGSRTIPGTKSLIQALEETFKLPPEADSSPRTLPIAYEDAQTKAPPEAIWSFLNKQFTGGEPGWRSALSKFSWRRIWTLNIDDLPESIFPASTHIHFKDDYRPIEVNGTLQVVYLHGRAAVRKNFVFSIVEYRDQIRAPGPWQTIFFSDFNDHPFIVCGASLTGEADLASALRTNNQSAKTRGLPSLAVIKGLSDAGADRLRSKLGLIPVRAEGQEFFSALNRDVARYLSGNPSLLVKVADPNLANKFGRQFRAISEIPIPQCSIKRDFYSGDEPALEDIQLGLDAPLGVSKEAVRLVSENIGSRSVPIIAMFGGPGSGKSTSMYRILKNLSSTYSSYLFRNEDAFSADVAIACCEGRDVVLGFDNAADFGSEIRQFVEKARKRELRVAVVVSDRASRERGMKVDFLNSGQIRLDHSHLTASDSLAVIERRRLANRLGAFTSMQSQDIRRIFMTNHHADMMSSLASMELGAEGFQKRIREISTKIEAAPELRRLLFVIALVHRWGYALPLHFCAAASDLSSVSIQRAVSDEGELADVAVIEPRGVRFRHRIVAERFFSAFDDFDARRSLSLRLAESLAPVVNVKAIRFRSYEFRLSRVVMDRRNVIEVTGGKEAALEWFEGVEDSFEWNSRYWEQRALLEAENGRFAPAYSFAKVAVSKEKHPFPLTTLGVICFMHSAYQVRKNLNLAWDLYCEGVSALDEAMVMGRERPETVFKPIATYLDNTMKLSPHFVEDVGRKTKITSDFYRWMSNEAEVDFCGDNADARKEIKTFYLKLAVI